MDYGALPPEVNSGRMYAGPGSDSMLAAAAAWNRLAAELGSAASAYESVIAGLTGGAWLGPTSTAMAAAATPYMTWTSTTAAQAEHAAAQARAGAAAYNTAFTMTVPPPVIAANRALQATLVATNFLGQNTPAIAATEAHYGEMWAQDAAAMYGYAANSATASQLSPFNSAPQTTNPAGTAAQAAAAAQAAGTSAAPHSALSQLLSSTPATLQAMSTPTDPTSLLSGLFGTPNGSEVTASAIPEFGAGGGGLMDSILAEYAFLPGFFGLFAGINAIAPVLNTAISSAMTPDVWSAAAEDVDGATGWEDPGAWEDSGAWDDYGSWGGMGDADSVGELSVPQSWGWTADPSLEMPAPAAAVPLDLPATGDLGAGMGAGAGMGMPLFMGGLPRAAAVGAAAGAGVVASKYGSRLTVMARPPDAGNPDDPAATTSPEQLVPAGHPANRHAPPGYRAALVYVPHNRPVRGAT